MKSLIQTVAVAAVVSAALAAPAVSFAQQSSAPVTRAQVRAELVSLEKLGYHTWDFSDTTYPDTIQEAEAKLAAQSAQRMSVDSAGGTPQLGASQSGAPGHKLVSNEQAGYRPVASDPSYPSDIETAQAKVAAQDNSPAAQSVGGGTMTGASQSGAALALNDAGPIFAHH